MGFRCARSSEQSGAWPDSVLNALSQFFCVTLQVRRTGL